MSQPSSTFANPAVDGGLYGDVPQEEARNGPTTGLARRVIICPLGVSLLVLVHLDLPAVEYLTVVDE